MTSLHPTGCTTTFQESECWDFGCNRGEAAKRLVWGCIWNGVFIRDAVEEFASSYSMLQHPLWNFHAPVPPLRCPLPSAAVHFKCSCALYVPAPLPAFKRFLFLSLFLLIQNTWSSRGGEKVRRKGRCSNFTFLALGVWSAIFLHRRRTHKTPDSLCFLPHPHARHITSQLRDY